MQKRAAIEHPPTSERSQRYIGSNWRKTLNAYTFKQGNLGPFTNYERTTTLPSTSFALSFKVRVQSWKNDDPVKDHLADQGRQDSGRAR